MKSRKTVFGLGRMAGWAAALGCWLASSLAMALSPWVTLKNCTLETSWEGNDGDSFLVKCPDLKPEKDILKVLRLYYVDTPESEDSLPERLEVQREYWDLPNVQTVVKCGIKAKQFTKHFLAGGFEVHTRWETALGRTKMGRHYALLSVDGTDLGYALVRNGLARVYGKGPDLDDLPEYHHAKANAWWDKLRKAEAQAKHEKKGCWAYSKTKGGYPAVEEAEDGEGEETPQVGVGRTGGVPLAGRSAGPVRATVGPVRAAPWPAFPGAQPGRSAMVPGGGGGRPAVPAGGTPGVSSGGGEATYPMELTTSEPLYIYSLRSPGAAEPMGRLRAGMAVRVLEDAGNGRVRVRFRISTGEVYEGAAKKADVGLE